MKPATPSHAQPSQHTIRHTLRQQIRQQRRALSANEQTQAAHDLLTRFTRSPTLAQAHHIALYLAYDGEIDTQPLIHWLWQQGRDVYLPVLHPFSPGHLLFLHYTPTTPMHTNRYGIAEPKLDVRAVKPAMALDLICTPLVAFDLLGQRLGMGGGYYDRTLMQWHQHRQGPRPVGLAHDCQHVTSLPVEAWDVPLPDILTPSRHFHW
ncbi:5-formyltetrahydrofolate cyclo-ligase [Photobacterium japonica]|uniref:5-formyltetrahydrofolate cyclo-ligase n=1 Tax=Photobacterium japonica TaxID=2910235 RepID=UPI003D0BE87F